MYEHKSTLDCGTTARNTIKPNTAQNLSIKHKMPVTPASVLRRPFSMKPSLINNLPDVMLGNVGAKAQSDKAVQTDSNVHLNLNEMRLITILRAKDIDPSSVIARIYDNIDSNNNDNNKPKVEKNVADKANSAATETRDHDSAMNLKRELMYALGDLIKDGTLTFNKDKTIETATFNDGEQSSKRYKVTSSSRRLQRDLKEQSFKRGPQSLPCSTQYVNGGPLMAVNYLQPLQPPTDHYYHYDNHDNSNAVFARDGTDQGLLPMNHSQLQINPYVESPFASHHFHQLPDEQYHPNSMDVTRMPPNRYMHDYRHSQPPTQKPHLYDPRIYIPDPREYPNM